MVETQTSNDHRIAMLIDGDNAQSSLIEEMITETGRYGLVTIRRIYGDWTTPNMGSWRDTLNIHAIQPIQQFRYTVGKNATDSAMIIDAMDILYGGAVNALCLVSSDSDYTRLATRIREKGIFVLGIGKKTTPRAFVNACDVFIYTENLAPEPAVNPAPKRLPKKTATSTPEVATTPELLPLLRRAIEMAAQDDGWAFLGVLGNRLRQLDPAFDPRSYGHRQLSHLLRANDQAFETQERKIRGGPPQVYVKAKG
jgi:hypothetical protein